MNGKAVPGWYDLLVAHGGLEPRPCPPVRPRTPSSSAAPVAAATTTASTTASRRERDPALAFAARVYRSKRWQNLRALQLSAPAALRGLPAPRRRRARHAGGPRRRPRPAPRPRLRPGQLPVALHRLPRAQERRRAPRPPRNPAMSARLDRHLRGPRGGGRLKIAVGPRAGAWERRFFHGFPPSRDGPPRPQSPVPCGCTPLDGAKGLCDSGHAPRGRRPVHSLSIPRPRAVQRRRDVGAPAGRGTRAPGVFEGPPRGAHGRPWPRPGGSR